MINKLVPLAIVAFVLSPLTSELGAHCQVPCGIFDDPARFVSLKEHATTIEKAATQIGELAGKSDAQSLQQVVRWVSNKESHAAEIQQIALDYFLAQRIKLPADEAATAPYVARLSAAHAIVVHAMKCKQSADPAVVAGLRAAIEKFEAVYTKG